MKETSKIRQQELWSVGLNYIYSYIEVIILNEGTDICKYLIQSYTKWIKNNNKNIFSALPWRDAGSSRAEYDLRVVLSFGYKSTHR